MGMYLLSCQVGRGNGIGQPGGRLQHCCVRGTDREHLVPVDNPYVHDCSNDSGPDREGQILSANAYPVYDRLLLFTIPGLYTVSVSVFCGRLLCTKESF